jgi:hypothetical protein
MEWWVGWGYKNKALSGLRPSHLTGIDMKYLVYINEPFHAAYK